MRTRFVTIVTLGCSACGVLPSQRSDSVEAFLVRTEPRIVETRLEGVDRHAPCDTAFAGLARCSAPPQPGEGFFDQLSDLSLQTLGQPALTADAIADQATLELAWHGAAVGSIGRAVEMLEEAVGDYPGDDRLRSSLASTYFIRGRRDGHPSDFVLALDQLQQAGSSLAVQFNRGLVLEALGLLIEAEAAWDSYILVEPDPAWREEARTRRDAVRAVRTGSVEVSAESLRVAFSAGDTHALSAAARAHPQIVREIVMEEFLSASIAPGGEALEAKLPALSAFADALVDRSLRDVLAAIGADPGRPPPELVESVSAWAEGLRAVREQSHAIAHTAFLRAIRSADDIAAPIALWAAVDLAATMYAQNDFAAAGPRFDRVIAESDPVRYPALRARGLWGAGVVAARVGRLEDALTHLTEGARFFEEAGEAENAAHLQAMSGEMRAQLGRRAEAWPDRLAAVASHARRSAGVRHYQALLYAAFAASADGLRFAAIEFQTAALRTAREVGTEWLVAEALLSRGGLRHDVGEHAEAFLDFEEARGIAASLTDPEVRERQLSQVQRWEARVMTEAEPGEVALLLDSVLAFYEGRNEVINLPDIYLARAQAARNAGDGALVEQDLLAAVRLVEAQRSQIGNDLFGATFGETWQRVFDEMIDFQIRDRRDPWSALGFLERSRGLFLKPTPPIEARQNPPVPDPDAGTTLLQFAVVNESVYRWTLASDRRDFAKIGASAKAIEDLVDELLSFASPGIESAGRDPASALGELLIPDGLTDVGDDARLVVVPDRVLNRIPFGALVDAGSGRHLIEIGVVSVAPSFAFIREIGSAPSRPIEPIALVGHPDVGADPDPMLVDLPGAIREVERVAALYRQPRVLMGDRATRAAFTAQLDGAAALHFGGHAFFDERNPEASYLALSSGPTGLADRLYASELAELEFASLRLVILSACSSLTPSEGRGAGLWGLALPFLNGGVDSVIGALWPIDDVIAEATMVRFHEALATGLTPSRALREAQLALLRSDDPRERDMSSWAGFELLGR